MKKILVCLTVAAFAFVSSVRADDAKAATAKTEKSKESCASCCSGGCDSKMAKRIFMSPKAAEQASVSMRMGAKKMS